MPRKRQKRRRPRRRRRRKYYAIARKTPVPLRFFTKLRYNGQIQLNPGAAGAADAVAIHGNSCYDPIVAAGGHQPRGFDELMAMYDHFVVIGSKITVTFQPQNTTTNTYGGIAIRDTGTTIAIFNDYMEGGSVRSSPLSLQGARPTRLIAATSPRKFLGRSRVLADPELKGSASGNPTEGFYYHIFAAASDASSDPGLIDVVFTIDYSVVLIEPKVPVQS